MRHEPSSGHEDTSKNYKVTWKSLEDNEVHERIFQWRDDGWDFYQRRQKDPNTYAATWDHIPAVASDE